MVTICVVLIFHLTDVVISSRVVNTVYPRDE